MDTSELQRRCAAILRDVHQAIAQMPVCGQDASVVLADFLGHPPDLATTGVPPYCILFLDTIVDARRVEEGIIIPLRRHQGTVIWESSSIQTYGDAAVALLAGKAVLIGPERTLALSVSAWPQRSPNEPPSEIVAQGPHAGFVEDLQRNIALIRHWVRDDRLRWRRLTVGTSAHLPAAMVYMEGLAPASLLQHVQQSLEVSARHLPFATDTSMVQEWLTRISGALFPTMQSTERPDRVAAALLEGRVVVLLDASPVATIAPAVFRHLLHTPMDYYNRSFDAILKRLVRLGSLLVAVLISPIFVAVATINQELIPGRLVVSIAQTRLDVPLPVVLEVLVMEVIIEMVREAGVRMPGSIGQTISIVGAIVIGQSAVMAGLISAPVVVVVSLGYIAATVVPSLDARVGLRFLRFPLILLAAWLGLFGLMWGVMILFLYLLSLESFGVPYLAPVAPYRRRGLQDTVWRRPLTDMRRDFLARRRRRAK